MKNIKLAQQQNDPELAFPQIKIEPMDSLIQKAVEMLKKINPNYFVGVRKIVVDNGSAAFGHVASGPGQDPAVIHINLSKIKSDLQSKMSGGSPQDLEKEVVKSIASTLSHERGHISSFKNETGFQGGEAPAEAEENNMHSKIDNYYNSLK